jgi:hypothetical protein
MFIFTTYKELWTCELMSVLWVMIILCAEMIYLSLFYCPMILFECNNIIILSLIIFYLNWNQYLNSQRYKVFWNLAASHGDKNFKIINLTDMISILNFIYIIVFYVTRWTKQDLTLICFEEFLNQLNLIYIGICLYLQ